MSDLNMADYTDVAHRIYELINESDNYSATLWTSHPNEWRVYVKTACQKRKDCGYVAVSNDGVERKLSKQGGTIEKIYSEVLTTPIEPLPVQTPQRIERRQILDEDGNDWYVPEVD